MAVDCPCPTPGAADCAPDASGEARALRRCGSNGWEVVDTCGTEVLCEVSLELAITLGENWSGQCESPVCDAGELRCEGRAIQRCPANELEWSTVDECASPELCLKAIAEGESCPEPCNPEPDPGCNPCPEPPFRCNAEALEECTHDGPRPLWTSIALCSSPEACRIDEEGARWEQ